MWSALIAVLLVFILNLAGTHQYKVCPTLDDRSTEYYPHNDRYVNCTYINGNLELLNLGRYADLSFLESITEVTGYVFIWNVDNRRLVLPNLKIIHGRSLMNSTLDTDGGRFALFVKDDMDIFELPALREISDGNVRIWNLKNSCFMNSIKWEEILRDTEKQNVTFVNPISPNECPPCHENCTAGCWGTGPLSCHKVSKINCSPQCRGRSCFGQNPTECCHPFCAGGCSGPTARDCFACKNVNDSGTCKEECPPLQMYNPATSSLVQNPDGKYVHGGICVEDCPNNYWKVNGSCEDFWLDPIRSDDGECDPLGEIPCPKVCRGGFVLPVNIHRFQGCTTIDGELWIEADHIYERYPADNSSMMHPDALEVFSTLREVTGYLEIRGNHPDFKNLSFLRNLEIINGNYHKGLHIWETSLESLDLHSLCEVRNKKVNIRYNPKLCFVSDIDWNQFFGSNSQYDSYVEISDNAAEDYCRESGLVCHEQCSKDGCWGTGPEECLWSRISKLNGTCVPNL